MKGLQKLLAIFCLFLSISETYQSKSHPITTLINAKWYKTPVTLEIAEYLFDESPTLYWDYIERINRLETPLYSIDSDSKYYKSAVKVAEELIGATHGSLLRLALSMHSLSPRVQAHFQIAKDIIAHGDCKTKSFATIGNKVACNLDELKVGLNKVDKNTFDIEDVYSFDHIYPGTENNSIIIIVYSDIGTKEFQEYHKFLVDKSKTENIKYISRHYIRNRSNEKVRLSGYGVELHLKSTEYKSQDDSPRTDDDIKTSQNDDDTEVDGFDFAKLKSRFPELSHSLDRFRNALLEKTDEIAPLKAWEFQELGIQAAQRVASIQGEEALQILQLTSQNFPTQAKSLLHQEIQDGFKQEMKYNIEILGRHLNIQPPDAALFINGLYFDAETLDVDSLLETLRSELRVLDGLYKLNIEGQIAAELLALDLSDSGAREFAIDIRDTSILWMNDLEKDTQYKRWPSSVMDLLRPTFPGMFRNIRKNLFSLVLIVDPITTESRNLIKLAESFVIHLAPIRLGILFDSRKGNDDNEADYRAILCAFNYISQNHKPREALSFLTDIFAVVKSTDNIKSIDVRDQMKKSFTELTVTQIDDVIGDDSDYDYGRQLSLDFLERIGLKNSPQVLVNGVPLPEKQLLTDEFEETVLTEIMQQTPNLQKAVYRGDLTDNDNIVDYLMSLPHIMPRLNSRILSNDNPNYLDLSGKSHSDLENVKNLLQLTNRDMTATLMENLKYFTTKHSQEKILGKSVDFLTVWIIADLNTDAGCELLKNALNYMQTSGGMRVAFIPNVEGATVSDKFNLNRLAWAATQSLSGSEATTIVLKWLQNRNSIKSVDTIKPEPPPSVFALMSSTELHMKMLRVYCQRVLNVKSSKSLVLTNGKIIGPLFDDEFFTSDDYNLIERFNNHQYGDKIREVFVKTSSKTVKKIITSNHLDDDGYDNDDNDIDSIDKQLNLDFDLTSDTILKLISILVPRQQSRSRFIIPKELRWDHTAVKLSPKSNNVPYFDVFAMLDPASKGAQKLAPILIMLRNVINCNLRLLLCAIDKHSDMPVKNFYRFVIESEPQFTVDGKSRSGPYARFVGVPASPLLTQNLQIPENWLVEVVRSVYDLDNIKLIDINGPVHSEYELEHLLLEGHCFDATSGAPPRGLQFTLGGKDQSNLVDTIVMANLGYFQLKANPGAWLLKLRHGKSADIYEITSADGPNTIHNRNTGDTADDDSGGTIRVIISSFRSHVLKIKVTKKPGQQNADLLGEDTEAPSGIWDSIASSLGGGSSSNSADQQQSETINIFSVASGHLYERLLRIMMLSLLKHTESPVKFWFLKNYLSPQFIDFLPDMSREYNFQYELVQYKWPRWLHQQSEKQRIIWGYKILFLDVLFPLDVKKIIFVDADAIVRADMKELNALDLGGAPYAYTPFCDSRTDMDGFRFWKLGYWRNHLQGRKYHISALYVVDLKRFRKIAAGDRLRGQYQALSQDPNSLSNLDQDLPNNMIHQVAIKSLPQEWLWCQTWCSDESLGKAKTIDLCNNPMTKEAKLTAAQRIVPEWKDYDTEIKNLMNRIDEDVHEEHPQTNIDNAEESNDDLHVDTDNKDFKQKDIHSEL